MTIKDIQVLSESYKKVNQLKEDLAASQITNTGDLRNYAVGWLQGILKENYTTIDDYRQAIQRMLEFLSK